MAQIYENRNKVEYSDLVRGAGGAAGKKVTSSRSRPRR